MHKCQRRAREQMCWVLGWMRGFLLPLAQDSCGHIHDGEADLWEEAGTASAQKVAGEIHPGKNRLLNTLARALCVQGWRGLRSCSVRSHQIEALQGLQRANRNILVGGTSGGVLPSCSCLPAQSVPAIATSWHSLLLLGMDVNKVRPCRSTVGQGKQEKHQQCPRVGPLPEFKTRATSY